ncbi:TIGR01777 family oxidoreductase [Chryseolinea sp. T2]|uniref:TIGR01777 family oxidoreductase n=1 Tax=Chryseolinea sp. T2 TaxID=3129255 RepID=UPI003076D03D
MATVLITGGTGMIGSRLTTMLLERGHAVVHLERSKKNSGVKTRLWDINAGTIDADALAGIDAIIHLAGANIGERRWTSQRKKEILDSRINSTQLLHGELGKAHHQVKTFICASAVGYYGGDSGDIIKGEGDHAGHDFLADVSRMWEEAASEISELGIRVVRIRTGVVLSPSGGALEPMAKQARLGFAAPLGSGNQYMSWIHIDDHCSVLIHAIENDSIHGPYNSVAPHPVTNQEFTRALTRVLRKPMFMPNVPGFVLKIVLGEMSLLVLGGCKVSSEKLSATGFRFKYPDLDKALKDVLSV